MQFAIKRTGGLIATFFVLILVTFFLVRLIPGDPAISITGAEATNAEIARVRAQLGLNEPLLVQLWHYFVRVLHGNLGNSFTLPSPVLDIILARAPFTAIVAVLAMVLVIIFSVPLGMLVGVLTRGSRRRWLDLTFGLVTALVGTIPGYVMATLFVVAFAVKLGWLPPAYSANQQVASFVMPVIALAIGPTFMVARIVRREVAVVLEQDYMRTARGWRLSTVKLYFKYALPNLLTSTLTLGGMILASMLGGAIVLETVFGWPGLGLEIVRAIVRRDYPEIQGIILILGIIAALLILLVDILLGIIDPRTLGGRHASR